VGFTYTSPNPKLPFVITLDPISSMALFVMDEGLTAERHQELGIPVTWTTDANNNRVGEYKNHKIEGGSKLFVRFNRTFLFGEKRGLSLQYETTINSFYGWITQNGRHDKTLPEIVPTAEWLNTFSLKPLKFLTLQFQTTTRYDKSQVDKVQMKYYMRVGLEYRLKNR
jgi:hypothetical protein